MKNLRPVSVVIPTYNSAPYLIEALESVLIQTYPIHEIIIVDDGSSDNTVEVLEPYSNSIIYLKQHNAGSATARNTGIERATGEWVAFLDSDDVWEPDKIEKQVAYIQQVPELICIHNWFYFIGDWTHTPDRPKDLLAGKYDLGLLITNPVIHPSTAIIRRDLPARFVSWGEPSEDMIYFAEISMLGHIGYVDALLTGHRKRAGSVTKKPNAAARSFEVRERWIREMAPFIGQAKSDALIKRLNQSLVEQITLSKWLRDWPRYWTLREYLHRTWSKDIPLPSIATERVYPSFVYRFKDGFDRIAGK
jgi:glycosyltransferase involved in cell wall biosynthesis